MRAFASGIALSALSARVVHVLRPSRLDCQCGGHTPAWARLCSTCSCHQCAGKSAQIRLAEPRADGSKMQLRWTQAMATCDDSWRAVCHGVFCKQGPADARASTYNSLSATALPSCLRASHWPVSVLRKPCVSRLVSQQSQRKAFLPAGKWPRRGNIVAEPPRNNRRGVAAGQVESARGLTPPYASLLLCTKLTSPHPSPLLCGKLNSVQRRSSSPRFM